MGYYWALNISQRLLGPWLGINPIGYYVIIVQPPLMIWWFLTDCKYPVMSHIKYQLTTIQPQSNSQTLFEHPLSARNILLHFYSDIWSNGLHK